MTDSQEIELLAEHRDLTIDDLLDHEKIRQLIYSYARGIDRHDMDLVRSVFWPGATEDHGRGTPGTADDFCRWAEDMMVSGAVDRQHHQIGNIGIDLCGHHAAVETFIMALYRARQADGDYRDEIFAGRYLDHMEKRSGQWKILDRRLARDWIHRFPGSESWETVAAGATLTLGAFRPEDPLYDLLARVRRA